MVGGVESAWYGKHGTCTEFFFLFVAAAGTGTSVGSNQPLESMSAGQITGVAQADPSTTTQNGGMSGIFQPLAG